MWPRIGDLRTVELGLPGEQRDRLTGLVLAGRKRATAGMHRTEYLGEGEAVETVGERLVLVGNGGEPVGLLEVTRVEVLPFLDVPWEFAAAEGEGDTSIEEWREGHRAFFAAEGTPVGDDDAIVCIWFRLLDEPPPTT